MTHRHFIKRCYSIKKEQDKTVKKIARKLKISDSEYIRRLINQGLSTQIS